MSALDFAFVWLLVTLAALVVLFLLGNYVISKYPNAADPARSARRFVVPAGLLVGVILGAAVAFILSLVAAFLGR